MLNDHSHTFVLPGQTSADLRTRLNDPVRDFVVLDFVRRAISDVALLRAAIDAVESVTDELIDAVLASVPTPWWPSSGDDDIYARTLKTRRSNLRRLFEADRGIFLNLPGGPSL